MPYIKQNRREVLDPYVDAIVEIMKKIDAKDGDYNYLITRILTSGFELNSKPGYSKINTIVGVLDCIKLELYRRIASKYEQEKTIENGDVKEYEEFDQWFDDLTRRLGCFRK